MRLKFLFWTEHALSLKLLKTVATVPLASILLCNNLKWLLLKLEHCSQTLTTILKYTASYTSS